MAPSPPAVHLTDPAQVRALLRENYYSDGTRGYFLDPTGPPGSGIDLTSTYWWAEVQRLRGIPTQLDAGVLGRWLPALAEGRPGPSQAVPTSRLNEQDLAVRLALAQHVPFDTARAIRSIEALRRGDRYTGDPGRKPSGWGETAAAVALLRQLHGTPPAQVIESAHRTVTDAPAQIGVADALNTYLPALTISAQEPSFRAAALRLLHRVQPLIPDGLAREVMLVSLERAGLTTVTAPPAQTCTELLEVLRDRADPHRIYNALTLKCPGTYPSPPPWGPSGWPEATDSGWMDEVASTRYGMLLAAQVGDLPLYRSRTQRQIAEWTRDSTVFATQHWAMYASLLAIAQLVSTDTPQLHGFEAALSRACTTRERHDLWVLAAGRQLGRRCPDPSPSSTVEADPLREIVAYLSGHPLPPHFRAETSDASDDLVLLSLYRSARQEDFTQDEVARFCTATGCRQTLPDKQRGKPLETAVLLGWDYQHASVPAASL